MPDASALPLPLPFLPPLLLLLLGFSRAEQMALVWDDTYIDLAGQPGSDYGNWTVLRQHVLPHVRGAKDMLQLGCGNSPFAAEMAADAEAGVPANAMLNTDFSPVVVAQMRARYPALRWAVADALALRNDFGAESFDAVVEKGVLASFEGYGDVADTRQVLQEVWRVLRWGGVFLSVCEVPVNVSLAVASAHSGELEWVLEDTADIGEPRPDDTAPKVIVMRKQKKGGDVGVRMQKAGRATASQGHGEL